MTEVSRKAIQVYITNFKQTSYRDKTMWNIQYKPDKNSQEWLILNSYDNRTTACFHAYSIANKYYMVIVTEPDGSVIWSN